MMTPIPEKAPGHHLRNFTPRAQSAIITGDSDRIQLFASATGTVEQTWRFRQYEICEVNCDGTPILMASHGIGGPATAILVEELADFGVSRMIRVGTCGPLQPDLSPGLLLISAGAVRDDGTSKQYLPIEIPAIPNSALVGEICSAADRMNVTYRLGMTHCKDAYYCQDPRRVISEVSWADRWQMLRQLGVLATDGESAALLAVAAVRRIKAAATFVVGGEPDEHDLVLAGLVNGAKVAVTALRALSSP